MDSFKKIFSYKGLRRTRDDHFRNAILLSFVAGIVNIVGFLDIAQLTTNVTGHFALFVNEINNGQYWQGINYVIYILFFLLGSFSSGLILGAFKKTKRVNVYIIPVIIEILILLTVIILKTKYPFNNSNTIADLLLFAMGMQNAYVTHISKAVVRTTHLTGLFTDLGIEMANFLIRRKEKKGLNQQIKVHFFIILFFFFGGIIGGLGYTFFDFKIKILYLAVFTLVLYLFYDLFVLYWRKIKRQF